RGLPSLGETLDHRPDLRGAGIGRDEGEVSGGLIGGGVEQEGVLFLLIASFYRSGRALGGGEEIGLARVASRARRQGVRSLAREPVIAWMARCVGHRILGTVMLHSAKAATKQVALAVCAVTIEEVEEKVLQLSPDVVLVKVVLLTGLDGGLDGDL